MSRKNNHERSPWVDRSLTFLTLMLAFYLLQVAAVSIPDDDSIPEAIWDLVVKDKDYHNQETEDAVLDSLQSPNSDQLRALRPQVLYQFLQKINDSLFNGETDYSEQDAVNVVLAFLQHPDAPEYLRQNNEATGSYQDEFIILSGSLSLQNGVVDFYFGNNLYFSFTPPRVPKSINFEESDLSSPEEVAAFLKDPENEPINYRTQVKQAKSELVASTSAEIQSIKTILDQHDIVIDLPNSVWLVQTTTTVVASAGMPENDLVSVEYVVVDPDNPQNRIEITRRYNPSFEGQEYSYQLGNSSFGAVSSEQVKEIFEQADALWQQTSD